jgi:predicted XRE-type DNA-binding protein
MKFKREINIYPKSKFSEYRRLMYQTQTKFYEICEILGVSKLERSVLNKGKYYEDGTLLDKAIDFLMRKPNLRQPISLRKKKTTPKSFPDDKFLEYKRLKKSSKTNLSEISEFLGVSQQKASLLNKGVYYGDDETLIDSAIDFLAQKLNLMNLELKNIFSPRTHAVHVEKPLTLYLRLR